MKTSNSDKLDIGAGVPKLGSGVALPKAAFLRILSTFWLATAALKAGTTRFALKITVTVQDNILRWQ